MKTKIKNLEELKWEMARLTERRIQQEAYLKGQFTLLKDRVNVPVRAFNRLSASIPGVGLLKDVFRNSSSLKNNELKDSNWLQSILRVGIPLVLNRTFLRKSGLLKKSIILFLTDSVARQVSQDSISKAISKVAGFIRSKKKTKKLRNVKEILDEERVEDQILGI